jgi:hypothetical protein
MGWSYVPRGDNNGSVGCLSLREVLFLILLCQGNIKCSGRADEPAPDYNSPVLPNGLKEEHDATHH